MDTHSDKPFKKNKKKMRSFIQTAKRKSRRGDFGSLEQDEYDYYMSVLQRRNIDEDLDILVENFFREFGRQGQEYRLASSQIVSRILDQFLPLTSNERVLHLCRVFQDDIRTISANPYASHVMQTLLTLSLKKIQPRKTSKTETTNKDDSNEPIASEEQKSEFTQFIFKVSKFLYNNMDEFILDRYASHVLRTVMQVCSGVDVLHMIDLSKKVQENHAIRQSSTEIIVVPSNLEEIVPDILIRLTKLPNLRDIFYSECGSIALQTAIHVGQIKDSKKTSKLIKHILKEGIFNLGTQMDYDIGKELHKAFSGNTVVRLLECLIEYGSAKSQKLIYEKLFKGNLSALVTHPTANFTVQKLFSTWKDKETFGDLYDEISSHLEKCTNPSYSGVILGLVSGCGNLKSHQSRCYQMLLKIMECEKLEKQVKIASLLLYYLPEPEYTKAKASTGCTRLHLNGSLIIQKLLNYQKPIKIVNSILECSDSDLMLMCTKQIGSRIVDAFMTSPTIGEKSREKFIYKFKGSYAAIGRDRNGSRSLDAMWEGANIKTRSMISSELYDSKSLLQTTQCGSILFSKYKLDLYKQPGSTCWLELQKQEDKKRKLLKLLIDDDGVVPNESTSSPKKEKI